MSTETDTTQVSGGEAVAEVKEHPAPKSDAEAEQQEAAKQGSEEADKAAKEAAAKKEEEQQSRKKNRTKAYIERINAEKADLARRVAELEAKTQPNPPQRKPADPEDGEPTLEQFDYDPVAFQRAHSKWAAKQELQAWQKSQQEAERSKKQQEIETGYNTRVDEFADEHPDFQEVVGSIDPRYLPPELQAAIMAHELGPQIAYHLGNNDDDLWAVASIRPELMPDAVARLASRLTAAPPQEQNQPPVTEANKPITQAPAPTPKVTGRTPTDTPPEKLTDDEWYKREKERERKR